jgi:hypothetical protein
VVLNGGVWKKHRMVSYPASFSIKLHMSSWTKLACLHRSQIQHSIDQCLSSCLEDCAKRWWHDLKRKVMVLKALMCQCSCNGKFLDLVATTIEWNCFLTA